MFATMLTCPRINTGIVTPSQGLFNPAEEKIINSFVQQYTLYDIYVWGSIINVKIFTWGGGLQYKVRTSHHSETMLKIDGPIPTSHWPLPFPKPTPFNPIYPLM
jgi:hypothetical protein